MNDFVIHYGVDTSEAIKKIRQLDKVNKQMAESLGKNFTKATSIVKTSLNKVSQTKGLKKVGKEFKEVTTEVFQAGTVIKTTNGKYKNFVQTLTVVDGKLKTTKGSLKDVTKQYTKTTKTTKKASKATKTYAQNVAFLAKRAITVIPIWLALRSAITGVINVFRNGIRDIASFDRILQKTRQNLQGTGEEIEKNFKTLKSQITALSIESGKSVEDITSAFQRFATVGFDFETSMTGAIESTKLAVTLFGDVEQNANALARAFRVLVDTSDGATSSSEQLQEISALLAVLWKDQAFEIDEMAGALERFAPVASIANFSMKQTIQVLAGLQTAGIRGTRAGRLLSTAVLQLNKNFDKLQTTLGLNINPQLTSTFDRLKLVVQEIGKLQRVDDLKATQVLQELFGGVRGAQVPASLATEFDNLIKVLSQDGDIAGFQKRYEDITTTTGILTEKFNNLNKEIGKTFLTSLVGAEDFNKALQKIIKGQEIISGKATGLSLFEAFKIVGTRNPVEAFFEIIDRQVKFLNKDLQDFEKNLKKAVGNNLDASGLKDLLTNFRAKIKFSKLGFDDKQIKQLEEELKEKLENLTENITQGKSTQLTIKPVISESQLEKLNNAIIKSELEQLRSQGALTSQLIERENRLEDIFGINRSLETSLDRQLDKERALSEEKRLQSELGNESLKLFRIAKESGTDVAKNIADVLSGETDFSSFIRRGGEAVDIFKDKFADIFEQQQALAFFKGDIVPGEAGLRGGTRITVPEEDRVRISDLPKISSSVLRQQALIAQQSLQTLTPEKLQALQAQRDTSQLIDLPTRQPTFTDRTAEVIGNAIAQTPIAGALTSKDLPTVSKSEVIFKVQFEGEKPVIFEGSKEDFAKFASEKIGKEVEEKISKDLINPGSKVSQANSNAINGNKQSNVL